jgi:hypothetical protein
MIPLPPEEIASLIQQWDDALQRVNGCNFTDASEAELILIMLLSLHELKAQGYRRMYDQWVHVSEMN